MSTTRHILSVDPGKATGVAVLLWSGKQEDLPEITWSGEVQPEEFATTLTDFITIPHIIVVCEKFTITVQTAKNSQAPYSLEQIGVLKHLCRTNRIDPDEIHFQSPADAKNMFPNDALKKIGTWHKGGEGHANDAIRHALLRLVKSGWQPKILLD